MSNVVLKSFPDSSGAAAASMALEPSTSTADESDVAFMMSDEQLH